MDSTFVNVLLNSGVAGVVILAIIFEWLVPKPTYRRGRSPTS